MKLIIDVPEAFYEHCKAKEDAIEIQLAVKNGTPLDNLIGYSLQCGEGGDGGWSPINMLKELREEIAEEAELAYADFDAYKESVLETEADDLPNDDFRYGMERCMVIINNTINHLKKEGMT